MEAEDEHSEFTGSELTCGCGLIRVRQGEIIVSSSKQYLSPLLPEVKY